MRERNDFFPYVKQTNKKNPAAKRNKERAFFFDPPPQPRFFIVAESPSPLVLLRRALLAESRCGALRKKRATVKRRLPANPAAKKKNLGSAGSFSVALPAAAAAARMLAQIQKEKKLKGRIASIIGSLRLASNPHPPRGYICDAPHGSRALAESISRSRGPGRGVFN